MPSSITFDVTLRWPSRRASGLDVRLTAPDGATLADVLPLICDVMGSAPVRISCRGETVAAQAPLGVPPLVHGVTLVLDEPHRPSGSGSAPMDVAVVAGPDAGRRIPLTADGVVVGRSAGMGLTLADERLSRRHARITLSDNGFRVTDLSSTNGTRCGSTQLEDGSSTEVDGSDVIAIGDSLLRLVRAVGTTASMLPRGDGRIVVNRSPRTRPPELSLTITAPTPPSPPRRGRIPWIAAALPLPFAGLLAVFFGPQMLAFALLSPLMLAGNVLGDRWGGRREYARDLAAHEVELAERQGEFEAVRRLEREQRWRDLPDPATVLDIASGPGTRLWERRRGAPDLGRVRLGVGALPTRTAWVPPGSHDAQHPAMTGLPVEVGFDDVGGLGIAGSPCEVEAMIRHVLGQIATLHSPRDVLVLIRAVGRDVPSEDPDAPGCDEAAAPLSWTRWLPHTAVYGDLATCLDALRQLVVSREAERERGRNPRDPRVLLVLPESESGLGVGELVDLIERGRDLGVWCLVGARTAAALPSSCRAVVGVGAQGGARAGDVVARLDIDGAEPVAAFIPDQVGWWWGERIGRSLAAFEDAAGHADVVPGSVDLLDVLPWLDGARSLTPAALSAHWGEGGGAPLARVGRLAGEVWTIDLASDGPHLLVGGTTGSGKSELLRTLVTSLALECSPEDMTFVLVDYKGGSAFGECADLPHTVGLVTNLDEGLARRALISLGAEITRREGLLAASGARDFADHRRRVGDSPNRGLPRLVIVIDEFRLLADELPDFVDGVVSLAAVGRSLGVHLVLATQRPAGAITADIQANVNLRIAMRMRDVADSTDVIGSPDAAHLSTARPGRGFARGGDGELLEFQAARVGSGMATAPTTVTVLDQAGRPEGEPRVAVALGADPTSGALPRGEGAADATGLGALAATTREAASMVGVRPPHRPWLPPLPDLLEPAGLGASGVGLVDSPAQQRQDAFDHADHHGHWLVVGGPRSGRTTSLRTILASQVALENNPVHAYVIDSSGELADLADLPHVGAVVRADDVSRVRRLLAQLRSRTERRPATAAGALAPALLLVDGWERLDADADLAIGGLRDELLDLCRGGDNGLRAVVTGDRSALSGRLSAVISETFVLPLADPSDATYAGLSRSDLPSSRAPGRGLRLRDRTEVQFALRDPLAEAVARPVGAAEPFALPQLPDVVDHALLLSGRRTHGQSLPVGQLPIGLSAETGATAVLDPERHGRRILVAGHSRSGRSTTLASLARSAVAAGRPVSVVEGRAEEVGRTAGVIRVDPWDSQGLIDAKNLHPDLVVLIDDAERLDGTPVEPVLQEILALVDRDAGLVVAASTLSAVSLAFRGIVHTVAREQSGILLGPRAPSDGEAFAIRAPRGLAALPGRALLVSGRQYTEVQIGRVLAADQLTV
ncbi:putative cell division-related protein [Janibacter sp. HTCC2649]|uniref:FtsK/SpoIIIE domain-containing protein n=1 Tax=Janibacter sp. HTCC2649 TaxID=313589 RepID=UPI0000670FEE|nr:FtsK/SpoIIIE domain-containing protein [Janibacter sp. HTCC2649]EAP97597.1 putative cell division-related protein [Janibacter sp. HTCC2649]